MEFGKPYVIHEAEVAIWRAYQDGHPMVGPSGGRGERVPAAYCHANLGVTMRPQAELGPAFGEGPRGAAHGHGAVFDLAITAIEGSWVQDGTALSGFLNAETPLIVSVRWANEETGEWCYSQYHHCRVKSYELGADGERVTQALNLESGWREDFTEQGGTAADPKVRPLVRGVVDWEYEGRVVPALYFDPATDGWSEAPGNEFDDGQGGTLRHVHIAPDVSDATVVWFNVLTVRTVHERRWPDLLDRAGLGYAVMTVARVTNHLNGVHHGLQMAKGFRLQTKGCAEVIPERYTGAGEEGYRRHFNPVRVSFRYLDRIYAVLDGSVFAVGGLTELSAPEVTFAEPAFDPYFRVAPAGVRNPATGQTGMILTPYGAVLDGTLAEDNLAVAI